MSALTTIVCRSINPSLRRTLSLFLTEIAPLTFCGTMNRRVRESLWERLGDNVDVHEITCVYPDPSTEHGFGLLSNKMSDQYVNEIDGLIVGVRRRRTVKAWEQVLGKTIPKPYSLIRHLLDTAAVADVLMKEVLCEQQMNAIAAGISFTDTEALDVQTRSLISYLAGMHDIGKSSPYWQQKTLRMTASPLPGKISPTPPLGFPLPPEDVDLADHGRNGQHFFEHGFSVVPFADKSQYAIRRVVGGHHGVFVSDDDLAKKSFTYAKAMRDSPWMDSQQKIEKEVLRVLGIDVEALASIDSISRPSTHLLTGVVILADWIASQNSFIEDVDLENLDYDLHYQNSRDRAHRFVIQNGLHKAAWKRDLSWASIFPDFTSPNPFQRSLVDAFEHSDHSGGILLLSAPMGSGKTEASLYVGALMSQRSGGSGLWLNLPTKVTSNAMFVRASEIADLLFEGEQHSVALMHSDAAFATAVEGISRRGQKSFYSSTSPQAQISESDGGCVEGGAESNLFISEYLLEKRIGGMANVAVGTIDQAIKASLRLKHNSLRWLAISGKTIILDEVHDYDAYTFALIRKFVQWCGIYGVPVIAMSATLSGQSQRELISCYHEATLSDSDDRDRLEQNVESGIETGGIPSPGWVYAPRGTEIIKSPSIPAEDYTPYQTTLHRTPSFLQVVNSILSEEIPHGGTILCVCNTVKQSVGVYRDLQHSYGGHVEVVLLHSRMTVKRRQEIVSELLGVTGKPGASVKRKPYVLISTQVVQQSMDIDFDVLITPLSPLAEIFQRIGRIYRHNQGELRVERYRDAPQVHIVVEEGVADKKYDLDGNRTNASLVPYNDSFTTGSSEADLSWGCLSALEVIIKRNEWKGYGVPFFWDAKGEIHNAFTKYSNLIKEYKQRKNLPGDAGVMQKALRNSLNQEGQLKQKGKDLSICAPEEGEMTLPDLTSFVTERSPHRPATREINETVSVLLVWYGAQGDSYMDPDLTTPVPAQISLESMRSMGERVISVPVGVFRELQEVPGAVFESPVKHVQCVAYESLAEAGLEFTRESGLVHVVVEDPRYTWL